MGFLHYIPTPLVFVTKLYSQMPFPGLNAQSLIAKAKCSTQPHQFQVGGGGGGGGGRGVLALTVKLIFTYGIREKGPNAKFPVRAIEM